MRYLPRPSALGWSATAIIALIQMAHAEAYNIRILANTGQSHQTLRLSSFTDADSSAYINIYLPQNGNFLVSPVGSTLAYAKSARTIHISRSGGSGCLNYKVVVANKACITMKMISPGSYVVRFTRKSVVSLTSETKKSFEGDAIIDTRFLLELKNASCRVAVQSVQRKFPNDPNFYEAQINKQECEYSSR